MKIRIGSFWHVVVDCDIDTFDIDTTTEDIGGDADTCLELFEFFVAFDTSAILANNTRGNARDEPDVPFFLANA